MTLLSRFVRTRCARVPGGSYPVADFIIEFHRAMPEAERARWTRGAVLVALAREGFPIALRDRVQQIAGLVPRASLIERNGKLVLEHANGT